jgi:di/tricarboxylate transporter
MAALAPWLPPALTALILVAAIWSWVSERLPTDVTALLVLVALLLSGVLTSDETFAGFSHPAVLSVVAVLVLSAGLERTGVIDFVARRMLAPVSRSEFLLTVCLMLVIGAMSAFINNTAAVAVFIPIVVETCRRSGARPGRLMMPMSHAATFGGMCTLIGTSTNVVGHGFAVEAGLPGFGMFDFAAVGLPLALAGILWMLLVGRWLLPAGNGGAQFHEQRAWGYRATIEVGEDSPWIGRRASAAALKKSHDVELLRLMRHGVSRSLGGWTRYLPGDVLEISGTLARLLALENLHGLRLTRPATVSQSAETSEGAPAARREVVVLPGSPLVGRTIGEAAQEHGHGAVVIALHRPGEDVEDAASTVALQPGDVLAVEGPPDELAHFGRESGVLLVGTPDAHEERPHKLGIALLVLVGVVSVVALGWATILVAATAGCALLILTQCLRPHEAYRAIDLSLVMLLAGSLALGTALQKTGITLWLGELMGSLGGTLGPQLVFAAFLLVAILVSELMSNSGTVLLLAPIALTTSAQLGMNPMAMLAAVVFGSSIAFALPMGYQTSMMILVPGGYRVRDFLRVGVPLDLLLGGLAYWLIPLHWPLLLPPG